MKLIDLQSIFIGKLETKIAILKNTSLLDNTIILHNHSVLIDKVKYNQNLYMDYDRKEMFNIFLKQFRWE